MPVFLLKYVSLFPAVSLTSLCSKDIRSLSPVCPASIFLEYFPFCFVLAVLNIENFIFL